jgi:hypothetical protein
MPQYRVTAPDGKVIVLSGPEGASDDEVMRQAQTLYQQQQQPAPSYEPGKARAGAAVAQGRPAPSVGGDMARGGGSGLVRGAHGLTNNSPILDPVGFAGNALSRMGFEGAGNALSTFSDAGPNAIGAQYQPQTRPGRYSQVVGEFAPNALLPGGALARGAQVVIPAVASEGAADAVGAMGGGEVAQDVARVTGAVVAGGMTGAKRPQSGGPAKGPGRGPVPTSEALKAQTGAAYKAAEAAGVAYQPKAVTGMVDGLSARMKADNIDRNLHPKASAVLRRFEAAKNRPLTLTQLDQLRQQVRRDVMSGDPGEKHFGGMMIDAIDDLIDTDKTGGPLMDAARSANTRYRKVEAVEDATERARLRAGSTGSGGNVENATRQELRKVLEKSRNLTPQERQALERITVGTRGQNAMRQVGKLSPTGNGLNQLLHLGGAMGSGGLTLPFSVAGVVAKGAAEHMTGQRVKGLIRLMASGGPRALEAEAELAAAAAKSAEVAHAYNQAVQLLVRGGAAGAISAQAANQ